MWTPLEKREHHMILDNFVISADISAFPPWAKDRNIKSITPACYTDDEIRLDLERQIWRLGFYSEYLKNEESHMDFFITHIRNLNSEIVYYFFDVDSNVEYEYFESNLHNSRD